MTGSVCATITPTSFFPRPLYSDPFGKTTCLAVFEIMFTRKRELPIKWRKNDYSVSFGLPSFS